jgi:hypothetical protein
MVADTGQEYECLIETRAIEPNVPRDSELNSNREKTMFNKRSLFVAAAVVSFGLLAMSAAQADGDTNCYSLASIKGTYAAVATYGANIALALAVRHFDGHGNMTGTFTLNAPVVGSPTGERKIVTGTQVGTYVVNCDGTGTITRTLTSSTGVVTTQTDDFLITKAIERDDDKLLATALEDAQRTPSALVPGGLFVFRSYTRRPD